LAVAPDVYTSSTMHTARGTSPFATTLRRTFRRRSASPRPRWRGSECGRYRMSAAGSLHNRARAMASPRGATLPRSHARSGSPGTCTRTSTPGAAMTSATSAAASAASRLRPCSFQERTNVRARSSYTIAERARAKARRRPAHSAHRRTGQAPGEPHRSQTGGLSRTSASRHDSQSAEPGRAQTAQRSGKRSSSTLSPFSATRCDGSAKRCDRLPQESRRSRCRTTAREGATCTPRCAGRAIRSSARAGRDCSSRPGTA
jgi:hypothetical protein